MRITTEPHLFPGWVVTKLRPPQYTGVFAVKGTYELAPGRAQPWPGDPDPVSGDKAWDDDPTLGLGYASDLALLKLRGEVLAKAIAFAPGGKPVSDLHVRIRLGAIDKTLRVIGDREWSRGLFGRESGSAPRTFLAMPINYARAFGGASDKQNPVGRGRDSKAMPNIERPGQLVTGPKSKVLPAGFGPLSPDWEPRVKMTGSYRGNWSKERWPWLPGDFDLHYFNAAPADQQIEGYFRGDEPLELQNLHPEYEVILSALPGVRARCFLEDKSGMFREVPLSLDTVWLEPATLKLALVWRGLADVAHPKLNEVTHLFTLTEPLGEPERDLAFYRNLLASRLAEGEEEDETPPEEPPAGEEEPDRDAVIAALDAEFAANDALLARAEKTAAGQLSAARLEGAAARIAVDQLAPDSPALSIAQAVAGLTAHLAALRKVLPEHAEAVAPAEESLQEMTEMDGPEPGEEDSEPATTRESVAAEAAKGASFENRALDRLDLSGIDFSGLNLRGANFWRSLLQGAKFAGADLSETMFVEADLTGVDLTGAKLDGAHITRSTLAGARLTGLSLEEASLTGLELAGADFTGARGRGADFSKSVLTGASFAGVELPQADFCNCELTGADFRDASLPAAQFEEVTARNIRMDAANLTGLHASDGSDFRGGSFRDVKADGSIWSGSNLDEADFRRARLIKALLNECSLRATQLDRVEAGGATFDDACLADCILTNANLLRASFDRGDLRGAKIMGSNLYEAGFFEAITEDADFSGANLKGTLLA